MDVEETYYLMYKNMKEQCDALLEALEDCHRELSWLLRAHPERDGGLYREAVDKAEAAIAKAYGEETE